MHIRMRPPLAAPAIGRSTSSQISTFLGTLNSNMSFQTLSPEDLWATLLTVADAPSQRFWNNSVDTHFVTNVGSTCARKVATQSNQGVSPLHGERSVQPRFCRSAAEAETSAGTLLLGDVINGRMVTSIPARASR